MYKLPQLPHDQFAAFVCALFEQLLDDDFTLNEDGKLIESASGEVTILAIPLSIEQFQKEAIKELKVNAEKFILGKNKKYKKFIIATNYALELSFQDYLDDLSLDFDPIYLDWESLSILADNPTLIFLQFYPNLNFKKLPYDFKNTEDEITYYNKSITVKSEIWGGESNDVILIRFMLARVYEDQGRYLEALKENKINANILKQRSIEITSEDDINVICDNYATIGMLYYKIGGYDTGIEWFEKLLTIYKRYYGIDSYNSSFIEGMTGLVAGYLASGFIDKALNKFEEIEKILETGYVEKSIGLLLSLKLLGLRVYDRLGEEESASIYFNELWRAIEENVDTVSIESGLYEKEKIRKLYPQYYKKLKKQNHLINTTISHNLPTTDAQLPFAIKQVHIKAFQSIKDLKIDAIPVNAQWIFITGKNGSGKSSILKAITAGIVGDVIQEHIRPSTEKDCIISIELLQDNTNEIQTLKSEDRRWKLYKDKELEVRNIPLLAYGVSRLNIQTEGSEDRRYKEDNVFSLFRSDEGNLSNVEEWLKDEMLKILKANEEDRLKIEQRYKMVKDTLSKLMPSVSQVAYNDKEAHIEYTENGEIVKMERLASGNKSILAMVGDILIRLLRFYPNTEETEDFKGIIIIDELDLHLHPSWQREMPWLLSKLFPKVQFICSTHSIIPFMGAPKNSVFFTVDRTEEEGTTIQQLDIDVSNLSANILLSSPLFEVSLLSKVAETEGKSQEYRTETDYKEYDDNVKNSAAFKRMQEKYGDIFGGQKKQK